MEIRKDLRTNRKQKSPQNQKKGGGRTKNRVVTCIACKEANRTCDGKLPCIHCTKNKKNCKYPTQLKEQREGGEVEEHEEIPRASSERPDLNHASDTHQRIPSISQVVTEVLAVPPLSRNSILNPPNLPPLKPPTVSHPLPSISIIPHTRRSSSGNEIPPTPQPLPSIERTTNLKAKIGRPKNRPEKEAHPTVRTGEEKVPNGHPQSSLSYMGYSNLNQDSDEETGFKPQTSTLSSSGKRSHNDTDDSFEEDSQENDNEPSSRPIKRPRRRLAPVQRAIDDELHSKKTKRVSKPTKKKKSSKTKKSKEEKLPEDGVLAIDKFLLKRYNSFTKQCEYLVQWNGYDIHRSTWLAKNDIFAADYINEFEEEWANRLKERKENPPLQNHPSVPIQYAVGDKVWVKLKGHQWWPAQIVVHSEIDNGKNDYTVVFYGDNTFAFVNDYDTKDFSIEPFEAANAAKYMKKQNEKAIKEALAMLPNGPE